VPDAARKRAEALLISPDPMFASRPVQLATLAARQAMPAIFALREFAEVGGLISYGSNFTDLIAAVPRGFEALSRLGGRRPDCLPGVRGLELGNVRRECAR
jgi:putative ABC transport system substrate-binding protein